MIIIVIYGIFLHLPTAHVNGVLSFRGGVDCGGGCGGGVSGRVCGIGIGVVVMNQNQNLRLFDDIIKYHSCHRCNCDLQKKSRTIT